MITEEMLREAAERSCALHTEQLESACAEMPEHRFSPETEARILSMGRKHSRKAIYQFLLRTAAMLVLILSCCFSPLTFYSVATFDGWSARWDDPIYIYEYGGSHTAESLCYQITAVPSGYRLISETHSRTDEYVYADEDANLLMFSYISSPNHSKLYFGAAGADRQEVTVNGYTGDFLPASAANAATLIWWDENDRLFYLRGFFDAETLIQMAESIEIIEN